MFTTALFTIARTWTRPKCPSTDEWIKKMWHIYTVKYYSAIKRNGGIGRMGGREMQGGRDMGTYVYV